MSSAAVLREADLTVGSAASSEKDFRSTPYAPQKKGMGSP